MTNYWAVAANPKFYNIEKAVNSIDIDSWTTKGSKISKGDRLIIWKTLGANKKRGILCFGEVLDDPKIMDDSNNPLWVENASGKTEELRVPVRYIKNTNLPLWVGENHDDILLDLSVAKAQGGTVFKISPEQWDQLLYAVGGWPKTQKRLEIYQDYSREDVHDIFSPDTEHSPQTGTWGLQGLVSVPNHPGDFVFFVTYGQQQGEHIFDEGVDSDGVLTWQSQPKQTLLTKTIQQLINHDELINSIYLFLRTSKSTDYTFLGKLKYLSHDLDREQPVYFKWQIIDWQPEKVSDKIGLIIKPGYSSTKTRNDENQNSLDLVERPKSTIREGKNTKSFRGHVKPDYSEEDAKNKKLGLQGEELVLAIEQKYLLDNGKPELAANVLHVSKILGDGAGYDIESYFCDGTKKFIEVKTTKGSIETAFFMSSNEREFALVNKDQYYIYRVFDYDELSNSGKYFIVQNIETLSLTPVQYRVTI